MKTGIVCIIAFVAFVNGLNANPDAEFRDDNPYRRLLRRRSITDLHRCPPGAMIKQDCNKCFCPLNGSGWACTRMMCIPGFTYPDATDPQPIQDERLDRVVRQLSDPFHCVPNSTFMNDCNTCTCTPDGRNAMCTLMGCIHGDWPSRHSGSIV